MRGGELLAVRQVYSVTVLAELGAVTGDALPFVFCRCLAVCLVPVALVRRRCHGGVTRLAEHSGMTLGAGC